MMNYTLYENKLTADVEDDYMARLVNVTTMNREELVTQITGPGSILKETECNAVIGDYWKQIIQFLSNGTFYKDDHINIRLDVVGVFMGENDRFDPERHELKITIQPSAELKGALANIPMQYTKPEKILPVIESIFDWGTETTNSNLTPGASLEITGENLKIYPEEDEQGIYFLNTSNGTETKADSIRTNEPKTLTLKTPQLPAGEYRIEIRNKAWNNKNLRTGLSDKTFIVS
nr:DUF4469 domain-containing protein [uncultured Carboxylicivirga sp.]